MDPITLAAVAGVVLTAFIVMIGASVAWWMLRKTLTLLKRLVLLLAALTAIALVAGAGLAFVLLQ